MAEEKDKTEKTIEQLKAMQFMGNVHKLTPKIQPSDSGDGVAILNALKADRDIMDVILKLEGLDYDPVQKVYYQYRRPVMNKLGLGNFIAVISTISKSIEFSSFQEKEIPKFVKFLFKQNYPYFTIYYREYEIDKKDFNLLANTLFTFILAAFHKAKGGGHRNVVRGTYSEDLLGRFSTEIPSKKDKSKRFGLRGLNPFKRAKQV